MLPSYSFLYFCVLLVYLCLVNDLSINKIEAPQNRIKHIKQISFLLFFVHSLKPQVRIRGYELYMTLSRNMEWTYMRRKEIHNKGLKSSKPFTSISWQHRRVDWRRLHHANRRKSTEACRGDEINLFSHTLWLHMLNLYWVFPCHFAEIHNWPSTLPIPRRIFRLNVFPQGGRIGTYNKA